MENHLDDLLVLESLSHAPAITLFCGLSSHKHSELVTNLLWMSTVQDETPFSQDYYVIVFPAIGLSVRRRHVKRLAMEDPQSGNPVVGVLLELPCPVWNCVGYLWLDRQSLARVDRVLSGHTPFPAPSLLVRRSPAPKPTAITEIVRYASFLVLASATFTLFHDHTMVLQNLPTEVLLRILDHLTLPLRLTISDTRFLEDFEGDRTKTLLGLLAVCPEITYLSWDSSVSGFRPSPMPFPPCQNLTRPDFDCNKCSVRIFVALVGELPRLKYLTVTGTLRARNTFKRIKFTLPDSVATVGIYIMDQNLSAWIKEDWIISPLSSFTRLSSTSACATRCSSARAVPTVELRPPRPCSGKQHIPEGAQIFEKHLAALSSWGSTAEQVYSGILFLLPNPVRKEEIRQYAWVRQITLRTLGCDDWSDEQKWQGSLRHLAFIETHFPSLQQVNLCDRFNGWETKTELERSEASMAEGGTLSCRVADLVMCVISEGDMRAACHASRFTNAICFYVFWTPQFGQDLLP